MNDKYTEPFHALKYCGLKDPERDECEHCDRTYLRTLPFDGLDMSITVRLQCDECSELHKRMDKILAHGFKIKRALKEQQSRPETSAVLKSIAELEGMLDEHRRKYKTALDECRTVIQTIRRRHGK